MVFECKFKECKSKCCKCIRAGSFSYDFNKVRNVHFLVKPENAGISVMNFEKDALETKAKSLGVNLDLRPLSFVLTINGPVILNYFINHAVCPLINKDFSCKIYDSRPLTCKFFPLMPPGVMSSSCPYALSNKELLGKSFSELYALIGDSFLYFKLKEYITMLYSNAINSLTNKGLIIKLKTSDALKKFKNTGGHVEEFFVKNNVLSQELINELSCLNNSVLKLKDFFIKKH